MSRSPRSWDIFCNVIDNFGDVGVCWRLARQLDREHGAEVRLWVDDLESFAHICPRIDPRLEAQTVQGIEVRRWTADTDDPVPHEIVIEAFGCRLPENFVERMAGQVPGTVWINLEYLSAEPWIDTHHGLPSPHPRLPLVKHFFFPGFTEESGGLLRERDLLAARDAFRGDPAMQSVLRAELGLPPRGAGETWVYLFGYANGELATLLAAWAEGERPVRVLVPDASLSETTLTALGGSLKVQGIPFVTQERFDQMLWLCDVLFVRGEDSFVRAQWAGLPFVWQIYPQAEDAHLDKLDAFLDRYLAELDAGTAAAHRALSYAWNENGTCDWEGALELLLTMRAHAESWSRQLSATDDLAERLVRFCASRLE